jgi:hypothetical protein
MATALALTACSTCSTANSSSPGRAPHQIGNARRLEQLGWRSGDAFAETAVQMDDVLARLLWLRPVDGRQAVHRLRLPPDRKVAGKSLPVQVKAA